MRKDKKKKKKYDLSKWSQQIKVAKTSLFSLWTFIAYLGFQSQYGVMMRGN